MCDPSFIKLVALSRPTLHDLSPALAAGLALLFQNKERRRTLALYMLARLLQCRYNSLKAAGRWHFWGSDWQHGDTLLFAVSSAQASMLKFIYEIKFE